MAPTRKKSVNKRFLNEVSPVEEVKCSSKIKQQVTRKKKLFDRLGPKWSKGELQRFYKAYRFYGKDWKKVAAEVRNRSMEMVEALYYMNQAYLSLPEGTASVVGLMAMMKDHYDVLEGSQSEWVSNNVIELPCKCQKRKLSKVEPTASKDDVLHFHSSTSTDGCLSLLKKACIDGGQPRAVGKRTPRVPVSYLHKKDDVFKYASPKKKCQKSDIDDNDEVAHDAALALTEASHRGGSPQVAQSPSKEEANIKSLHIQSRGWMSDLSKFHDASVCTDWLENGPGSRDTDGNVDAYNRVTSFSANLEGVGNVQVHRKGKKFYGKKVRAKENRNNLSDDGGEACSGTEVRKCTAVKGKVDIESSNGRTSETSLCGLGRTSKKLFSGDEFSALDALQTLASLSAMETESSFLQKEERASLDLDEKSSIPEATSSSHQRDEKKLLRQEETLSAICGIQDFNTKRYRVGRNLVNHTKPTSEAKQLHQSLGFNSAKRKLRNVMSEDSHQSKTLKIEVSDEEDSKSMAKVKKTSTPSKNLQSTGVLDGSVTADQIKAATDLTGSTTPVSAAGQDILPAGKRSRSKTDIKRAMMPKEGRSSDKVLKNESDEHTNSVPDREHNLQKKLSCSLSSPMVRRWCTYEWFYSAIDYPWFSNKEFVEYLNHVGLGHIPRLTHVEWGVIRSSLGKPRRFSDHFLHEEREKLNQYRESVRKHYSELRSGAREGLPTDLAKPLSVGQVVIAVHPKTRELHGGSILTVDHDRCRVQFDNPKLGVEFIQDIDCMPLDPSENMPEALRKQRLQVKEHSKPYGQLPSGSSPINKLLNQPQVEALGATSQAKAAAVEVVPAHQLACCQPSVTQLQTPEADMKTFSELTCILDRKASSALPSSRQHHAHPGMTSTPWLKPTSNSICLSDIRRSYGTPLESESTVNEIVRVSRSKAHLMVDAAVQAISCITEGEDSLLRIEQALDSVDRMQLMAEPRIQSIRSPEHVNGSSYYHCQLTCNTSELQFNGSPSGLKSHNDADKMEAAIPSELITSCVATLLMIQMCTQQQCPPSDVAQIIDSAVTSLQPCCSQNLPLYRDIQMCMGRIKTQILALIPT